MSRKNGVSLVQTRHVNATLDLATSKKGKPSPIVIEIKRRLGEMSPALSIDMLVTRPIDAIRMSVDVADRLGHITAKQASAFRAVLADLDFPHPDGIEFVNQILLIAMNGRKRGFFKSLSPKRKGRNHVEA